MTPNREEGFLEDLLYFNALVLWDCVPEEISFQLYDSSWSEFKAFSTLEFSGEKERLSAKIDGILARVSVLDIVIPLFDTILSRSVIEKPLASLKGTVDYIDGLRMVYDRKKSLTSVFLVVPPGVTDGKAFSAAVNRKKDALQRLRKHQFELYYRYDMRLRALKLARLCIETLPMFPEFKSVARFDRRASDEGGRPRNWYQEVSRIGLAVSYFSSARQGKGIGDLQDFIAENNREPVPRHAVGEDLKRTCRNWGVSLLTGMGIDGYKSAVDSVWNNMEGSPDTQIRRAVDRFKSEQKEKRSKK